MQRRSFLQSVGAAVPTCQLAGVTTASAAAPAPERFTPIALEPHFNACARDFGPRPAARNLNAAAAVEDNLIHTIGGEQRIQSIPFRLGPADIARKSWVALSTKTQPWSARSIEIPIGRTAGFLCLAQFCDWDPAELESQDVDTMERIGETLATATLIYADGSTRPFPVRRRYEVSPPAAPWGRECFNSIQSNSWRPVKLDDPLAKGTDWGNLQYTELPKPLSRTVLWIWPLENPSPQAVIKSLRMEAASDDCVMLCGLTLYHGHENPLRPEPRRIYRITLPSSATQPLSAWTVEADLGTVCRTWAGAPIQPEAWLADPNRAALGESGRSAAAGSFLYAEVSSPAEVILTVRDPAASGTRYEFDLRQIEPGREVAAREIAAARIEWVETSRVWVHGRILDDATGRPTPVRLAFRSKEGRYIPPYGHRVEVNSGWFQDYGADTQVGHSSYAYVDGTFQVELPVGDVYVEFSKGFEYQAVRQRLQIAPGTRDVELRISRASDWRKNGWVTADTHVHFLTPSTAVLEAQAEGLNLVNLLAAQWGDLYTNVGDLSYGHLTSPDRETMVAVGTENRQHLMGHLGLLGGHGEPVFPMSADGCSEGYIGDPLWTSMSDWADACRKREGLVVAVHFPMPNAEMAAEIVLGKVDAVELYPRGGDNAFRAIAYHDWYRYLNCGYRVAAAGGTDKMNSNTPVGGNRTYAWLGDREFTFANWAAAVRAGRTFSSTGPLLAFHADGKIPGDEIALRAGGGSIEINVAASSYVPFHRLEVVWNGKVVAQKEEAGGTRQMKLSERVAVKGAGWLAARCVSRVPAARFGVSAHTSPVYVTIPGEDVFSAPAAAYFLKLIEGTQIYVQNLGVRPGKERFERVAKVLSDAHARLHARMEKHHHA
jgi:hypothetical protein